MKSNFFESLSSIDAIEFHLLSFSRSAKKHIKIKHFYLLKYGFSATYKCMKRPFMMQSALPLFLRVMFVWLKVQLDHLKSHWWCNTEHLLGHSPNLFGDSHFSNFHTTSTWASIISMCFDLSWAHLDISPLQRICLTWSATSFLMASRQSSAFKWYWIFICQLSYMSPAGLRQ